ncbi:MAG: PKD domain-containing protein [Bacteroidales bacterium]|nr:PKD domain-containing protein [Bacteroidales bacterium]
MKQKFEFLFLVVILIMAVLCLFPIDSDGQVKNYNVWLLSSGDIMDFNSGQVVIRNGKNFNYARNMLSLSDNDGNLILYGSRIFYDVDNQVISNLKAYMYDCFGVRDPVSADSYYVGISGGGDVGVADKEQNRFIKHIYKGIEGRFVVEDIVKLDREGGVTGVVVCNEVFFATISALDNAVSVYVVRDGRVQRIQSLPCKYPFPSSDDITIRYNADCTKLYARLTSDGLSIFDFDLDSKTIANETFVAMDQLKAFDFSENGDYIYFLQGLRGEYTVTRCRETDLPNLTNIETVATLTGKWGNHSGNWEDLQLAPDGNIYIGIYRWDKLSYITETDGECEFLEDAIKLSNPFGGRFPKMPRYQSSFKIGNCRHTVEPEYRGYPYTSISWDFGDGTPTDSADRPVHNYENPGSYTVTMTATFKNGIVKEVKKNVDVTDIKKPKIVKE